VRKVQKTREASEGEEALKGREKERVRISLEALNTPERTMTRKIRFQLGAKTRT
jgi:hypothetical protein